MKHIMTKRRIVGGLPPKGSKIITHNGVNPDTDAEGGLVLVVSSGGGPAAFQRCKDQAMCMDALITCGRFEAQQAQQFFRHSVSETIEDDASGLELSQEFMT